MTSIAERPLIRSAGSEDLSAAASASASSVSAATSDRASSAHPAVVAWVEQIAALTTPDSIVWCDGSRAEADHLIRDMVDAGTLIRVNAEHRPNSFVARSDPRDVARVESSTYICTTDESDAGPTNNWIAPKRDARDPRPALRRLDEGPHDVRRAVLDGTDRSPLARLGVQVTDSPYVVVSTGILTRMGSAALDRITADNWVKAVHSVGAPLGDHEADVPWPCNDTKYISHFPETLEIWSFGSAYGGNAVLAKKAFALRIASTMAREEGWLAEHMLIVKVTNPRGRVFHVAAAFPSACGKTNFAMMQPSIPGWKVETVGDDIAWLAKGDDGRLRAINPEAGFFGVAPGTGRQTNPAALDALWGNAIFTNVAIREDGDVWWEGMTDKAPDRLTDWEGRPWTPASGRPAAHPNSRFTVAADQAPSISDDWQDPRGVVIDAIIFGGRRATNVPLVVEARDWEHGVYLGATVSSEQTAAAEGTVGQLRRDPFAMLPFCGYNMADHWSHWLDVGRDLRSSGSVPRIFQVNWFRKGADGSWLWPGFGENARVLEWMLERVDGQAGAVESPLGLVPTATGFNTEGIDVDLDALFAVDHDAWNAELDDTELFFDGFGDRVPDALRRQLADLRERIA